MVSRPSSWDATDNAVDVVFVYVPEEPELAEVLADPEADGYDRTFSMCQVEAKEFQATVRSTAYRVLKGVCNPGNVPSTCSMTSVVDVVYLHITCRVRWM